ncbi:uncharacterized protein LOC144133138 isoform X2 [Amblyomma americanum]
MCWLFQRRPVRRMPIVLGENGASPTPITPAEPTVRPIIACDPGFQCRLKDCPSAPYECLVLEHQQSRCGGRNGPRCRPNQVCAYQKTGLVCIKCPCYGTDRAICVDKRPGLECGPNSIIQENRQNVFVCKGCASAVSVLTR